MVYIKIYKNSNNLITCHKYYALFIRDNIPTILAHSYHNFMNTNLHHSDTYFRYMNKTKVFNKFDSYDQALKKEY